MKYKLKEHVTDEMLEAGLLITDNAYRGDFGFAFENCFEAIKKVDETYDIVLQDREKPLQPLLYDKTFHNFGNPYECNDNVDITPYIQDLIDLNYVEVEE